MFASAWSIAALLLRFAAREGSTNFIVSSRGGTSGGFGALQLRPIEDSFPVRNKLTARRVLSTY